MKTNITLKKVGIITCAALVATTLTGGVMALAKPAPAAESSIQITRQAADVATNVSTQASGNASTEYIGETQAKAIALAHAGVAESEVSHLLCKLEFDDGIAEYDVEFWDGAIEYDYEINAISGNIIGYDFDMESYDAKPVTTPSTNASTEYIGEAQAKAIALAHAGVAESEASRLKCEFDFDDGYAEYEVEWEIGRMEYEYTISATDGTIWEHDVEYDD